MVNFRIISKIIGSLLFIEAFFMSWCAIMAIFFHEDDQVAFMMSMLVTLGFGFIFLFFGRNAENALSRRDAYLLVTSVWVIFSLFGMLPFLIHGSITNFTDAYFETISGFTTTGASIIDDVECLPHGILFWRSLTQWVGGLGIVFFTIAILPSLVAGSVKVFAAEATGPIKAKMHPRLTTTAKWIWSIYLLLTIGCGVSFWAAGMNWYEALNYSMTTTATGGFSIHNDGTNVYNSPEIDYISILFQFLAGINFTLLYVSIFKTRLTHLFRDSEFKLYVTVVAITTMVIMSTLVVQLGYGYERAFRESLFQVVSFMTTTGVYSDDVAPWCDAVEGSPQQLPAEPASQCRTARQNQWSECTTSQTDSPLCLLRTCRPDAVGDDNHHDYIRHRQHQCYHHRFELCQQRRSITG